MSGKITEVIIQLGGNLGDTRGTFRKVIAALENYGKIKRKSSLYRTEAWGMEGAPPFLNQVLILETKLEPEELLITLKELERASCRKEEKNTAGYQSRTLDLDILFYGNEVIEKENLTIPHPRLHLRNFTLVPLAEVAGSKTHPVLNKTADELLRDTPDTLKAEKL